MSKSLPETTHNLLSVTSAAEYLGVSAITLRRWDKEGKLKANRTLGGSRRYSRVDLDTFKQELDSEKDILQKTQLDISEAAQILGVTTKTLRNWEKDGKLSSVRDKHNYRVYDRAQIDNFAKVKDDISHLIEPISKQNESLEKTSPINSWLGKFLLVKALGHRHYKTAHFHVKKTHLYLGVRYSWYSRWHKFKYHPHIHWVGLTLYILGILTGVFFALNGKFPAFAAGELSDTWDFSVPGNYSLSDANFLEVVGNSARLKLQEYTSDPSTMLLMHLNETSGTDVADSSANNNDGTAQDPTWGSGQLNNALTLNGNSSRISIPDSATISLTGTHTLEGWFKLNSAISVGSHDQKQGILDKGDYQLYLDDETGKITYEIVNSATPTWTQEAGNDIKSSWDLDGVLSIESSVSLGSNVYFGTGSAVGDAEVWRWSGSDWTKVGGDGINDSWPPSTYEQVLSLTSDGTNIYAGLGLTAQDAEVWKLTVSSGLWSKIGGDSVDGSWSTVGNYEGVYSLSYFGGYLYAGLGNSNNDAELWRYNGSSWTQIGGLSASEWNTSPHNFVYSLINDGTYLYVGLGNTTNEAEVWRCNSCGTSPSWTKVGGDGVNSSWADATYETVYSMTIMGGNLYAGIGLGADESEVWRCNSCSSSPTWTKVADGAGAPFAANTDAVFSLANDGTYIYAGLGNAAGENDVWRCTNCGSSPSWTQIGGDGLNSGFTNTHTIVNTLTVHSGTVYAGLISASATLSATVWSWNGSAWTQLGGNYINFSWGYRGLRSVETTVVSGGYLYAGTGLATAGTALVWRFDGSAWALVGGQGVNNSWQFNTYDAVTSMVSHRGKLYVGLGSTATEAEVWRFDGSSWTQVGGDGVGSPASWTTAGNYEEVTALTSFGGYLYAGLGNTGNDGEIWRLDDSGGTPSWFKVGGDSLFSGWTNYSERINSLGVYRGKVFAGVSGTGVGDAELWECTNCHTATPSWSKIGGDGVNSSWADSVYRYVDALIPFESSLIVAVGGTVAGDAVVWSYNGSAWSKIGGDGVNSSWGASTYERVRDLAVYNGELFAGLGVSTGEGEVWKYNGTSWSQVGGDDVGWTGVVEEVPSLSVYKGKLYAGLGNTANADAAIWSYGNNGYLQSDTSAFDTNWHHVAATYSGTTMKIFIDGEEDATSTVSQTTIDSSRPLLIGQARTNSESSRPEGYFQGSLDEIRVSNTARTSFNSLPYSGAPQTIHPTAVVRTYGVAAWDNFTSDEALNGGSINYRLSSDGGTTWKYYNSGWVTSNSISEANSATVIDTNIPTFPVTNGGLLWQAILDGDGTQQVTLNEVEIVSSHDITDPAANASSLAMQRTSGGPSVSSGGWTNNSAPYFSWTAGSDNESGSRGYCLYLGTDSGGDPETSSGLISTTSPVSTTGTTCQFIIGTNSIDFATTAYRGGTWLSSSTGTYYFNVKAVDIAGNIFPTSASFNFKYDDTLPSNPAFVSPPGGFVAQYNVTTTWPTSGGSAPSDSHSGLAGLQYRISSAGKWYGLAHNGNENMTDLLNVGDGSYTTQEDPDYGGSLTTDDLVEGTNTIYFRTWDQAGNVTTTYVQGLIKINTQSPSEPTNLSVTPTTNTVNSFEFNWSPPVTYQGSVNSITYCYTVNTLPSANTCTFTSAGATQLPAGPFANQPGENILYLVARDEASNINYATHASVSFTANTGSPGIPLNPDIADISVKATNNWRLAITWEPPTVVGAGVASYKIERSTDNVSYAQVASTSGTSYVDTGLSQVRYYYKVKACDSANSCGALTSQVNEIPTGKFTEPAILTAQPKITAIGTKSVTINWVTDRTSDSRIAFGTSSGNYFGAEISNSNQVTDHNLTINNLDAGTTYYYKVKWVDEDGNQGQSDEKTFATLPPPTAFEVEAKNLNLTQATIQFTVKDAAKVNILYGKSTEYGGLKTVFTSTTENTQTTQLTDLDDGTKYFYTLRLFDSEGNPYSTSVSSFNTLPRPRISNLRFDGVQGEPTSTQKVTWTTNVPTTSIANYTPEKGVEIQNFNADLKTDHEVILRELADDTEYTISVSGRDSLGNLATSDSNKFRTALDTRAPKISEFSVETAIQGSGSDSKAQLIVSWKTDEPGSSQVEFGEGSGGSYQSKTVEDNNLVTDHIVIISELSPSKTYHLRAVSRDKAGNAGFSEDNTAITGRASENILDIIINSIRRSLGFLGNPFEGFGN